MDTQNDGLEKVTPFKNGNFWYQFVRFLGCIPSTMPIVVFKKMDVVVVCFSLSDDWMPGCNTGEILDCTLRANVQGPGVLLWCDENS